MTDDSEHDRDEHDRDGLKQEMRTEGGRIAYETAKSICLDPRASAQARANAVNALFRAGGYFDKSEDASAKEPHEMSREELAKALGKLTREASERAVPVIEQYESTSPAANKQVAGTDIFG